MLVYFTASIVGKQQYLANYQKIIDTLKSKDNEVISDHIMNFSESQIRMEKRDERIAFQEKLNKWITSCDCMIAETSFPSISVGYEISMALTRGKPVLILYSEGNPPSLLAHHIDEKLLCEKYSLGNVEGIIDDYLLYAKGKEEQRFTFYITSEIAHFLEEVSQKEKLPKAVFIRKLIEKELKARK